MEKSRVKQCAGGQAQFGEGYHIDKATEGAKRKETQIEHFYVLETSTMERIGLASHSDPQLKLKNRARSRETHSEKKEWWPFLEGGKERERGSDSKAPRMRTRTCMLSSR